MALSEKGILALKAIDKFYKNKPFSASDLTKAAETPIYASTLNSLANNNYLIKLGGSPVQFNTTDNFDALFQELENNKDSRCSNENLHKAKRAKNDEFYTMFDDIEAEVIKYKKQLRDKIIYLPCDDPAEKKSEFWHFFAFNFEAFGLKKLIATHYDEHGSAYKIWIENDVNGDLFIDEDDALQEDLKGNGDFRSPECIDILNECDIVITNPPFSLFREFVDTIMTAGKQFLIIGNQNAFTYKNIFKLIKTNKLWTGYNMVKRFLQPDGSVKTFGNICWFTNLDTYKRNEELILTKEYNAIDYPKYDNYDAIEVGRIVDIPKNYYGIMGVPITFIYKYNPNQFEILGDSRYHDGSDTANDINFVNGKELYKRILVRRKK